MIQFRGEVRQGIGRRTVELAMAVVPSLALIPLRRSHTWQHNQVETTQTTDLAAPNDRLDSLLVKWHARNIAFGGLSQEVIRDLHGVIPDSFLEPLITPKFNIPIDFDRIRSGDSFGGIDNDNHFNIMNYWPPTPTPTKTPTK